MFDRHDDGASRLQRIVSDLTDGRLTCEAASGEIMQTVLDRLDADRVSLWHFELPEESDLRALELTCFAARRRGGPPETSTDRLSLDEYRDYFNRLVERGTFVSEDTLQDPELQPMRATYLHRHDIRSLLDAAFALNGRAYGLICCEAVGRRTVWRPADVHALRTLTTRLAVLLSGADAPRLWSGPSLPLEPIRPPPP